MRKASAGTATEREAAAHGRDMASAASRMADLLGIERDDGTCECCGVPRPAANFTYCDDCLSAPTVRK